MTIGFKAMDSELQALHQNCTWTLTDLPVDKTPIDCKWVYKIKYKADGRIERYKVTLVAKRFTQIEGIDFFYTYSPVAKLTNIRLLLVIASTQNYYLHQLDVHNAFLHGTLEEVYMQLPPSLTSPKPNQVCKLLESIYGLKLSSRRWFATLSTFLLSKFYLHSNSDPSVVIKHNGNIFSIILVYVDNVVIAGSNLTDIIAIKSDLNNIQKRILATLNIS